MYSRKHINLKVTQLFLSYKQAFFYSCRVILFALFLSERWQSTLF